VLLQKHKKLSIIEGMADHLSEAKRSWNMSRIRSKNTTPELAVRKILSDRGLHYRLHDKNLPGKPDLVMRKIKTAVFVNGCFWHQHAGCKRSTSPKSNTEYWGPKLERNVSRQRRAFAELRQEDWSIVTVWECEAKDSQALEAKLKREIEL
jgi:DNA mismatch endonuclease (patch repair protein)